MQNSKMIIAELHKSGAVSGTVMHGVLKWGVAMLSIMNASVELHLHQRYLLSPWNSLPMSLLFHLQRFKECCFERIYVMHHHSNSVSGYLQQNLKSQNWAYAKKKTKKSIRKIFQSREGSKKKGQGHTKGRWKEIFLSEKNCSVKIDEKIIHKTNINSINPSLNFKKIILHWIYHVTRSTGMPILTIKSRKLYPIM